MKKKLSLEEKVQRILAKLYEIEEKVNDPEVMAEVIRFLSLHVKVLEAQKSKIENLKVN